MEGLGHCRGGRILLITSCSTLLYFASLAFDPLAQEQPGQGPSRAKTPFQPLHLNLFDSGPCKDTMQTENCVQECGCCPGDADNKHLKHMLDHTSSRSLHLGFKHPHFLSCLRSTPACLWKSRLWRPKAICKDNFQAAQELKAIVSLQHQYRAGAVEQQKNKSNHY